MTEPGWYHGQGDPVGTKRYWDGRAWAGEPVADASASGIVYYAAPAADDVFHSASLAEQSVGAVTFRQRQPEPAAVAPVATQPKQDNIPASAQLIAIGICALKAIPLLFMLLNTILVGLFGTVGLSIAYNEDLETALAWTLGMSLLTIAIGTALLFGQALGAARDNAVLLLVASLLMVGWDGLLTVGAWSNNHGSDHFFYTGLFLLQAWVFIGAIVGVVRGAR